MIKKYSDEEVSVKEYAEDALDNWENEDGDTAHNVADCMAKLLAHFVEKEILTEKQVIDMCEK